MPLKESTAVCLSPNFPSASINDLEQYTLRPEGLRLPALPKGRFRNLAFYASVLVVIFGILLGNLPVFGASSKPAPKNVLMVFSLGPDHVLLDQMESSIRKRVSAPINFYTATLDYPQMEEKSYRDSVAETFRRRFAALNLDLVITDGPMALPFVLEYRKDMLPGVPIVFTNITANELAEQAMGAGITGVTVPVGIRETLDLALRLHPDTKAVAVITGISTPEKYWLDAVHSELLRLRQEVQEIDVIGPPSSKQLDEIANLPPHTIALFQLVTDNRNQTAIGAWDVLAVTAEHLPTYSAWPSLCLDHGCIGGSYPDPTKADLSRLELAVRVLSGERSAQIPIVRDANLQVRVDWRALRRWKIPESALPPGSAILFRPLSVWDRYKSYIVAVSLIVVTQALLIAALLWQRRRKKKAEAVLRESEKRFRVMANATPSLIWMCDEKGHLTYRNDRRSVFTGANFDPLSGDKGIAYVHPEDMEGVSAKISQALSNHQSFSMEYRLRRSDGVYRWMLDVAAPRANGDGSFAGLIGSAVDVTEQKMAHEALQTLGGRLIEAQENERRRIARELHDDISQKLALLAIEIQATQMKSTALSEGTEERLGKIHRYCSEVAKDVQLLSHELHSSKLDYLGLVPAIRGFCRELTEKHGVTVDVRDANVPRELCRENSMCLFRVAQEALHNALKYSGVEHFEVEVTGTEVGVRLSVSDAGAGFDVQAAMAGRGLGLLSMQERIHLVRGSLSLESEPGKGTMIIATVPLVAPDVRPAAEIVSSA